MNILKVKELLAERGITSKELADRIGHTPASISRIIQGSNFPKAETLLAIASALEVDIKELFISTKESHLAEPLFIRRGDIFVQVGQIDGQKIT